MSRFGLGLLLADLDWHILDWRILERYILDWHILDI